MGSLKVLESGVVAHQLAALRLAPRQDHKALTLWPLLRAGAGSQASGCEHLLLGEALEDGLAGLAAADAAAAADLENRAAQPLLVLAGESLGSPGSGLVASCSVLAAPREISPVPVRRLPRGGGHPRPTQGLRDLQPLVGQVGFVSTLGDSVLWLELLGDARAFGRALPVLVAVHWRRAFEIAFGCGPVRASRFDAPEPFLDALSRARTRAGADLLGGRRLRLEGAGVVGEALLGEGDLVHLTARATSRRTPPH